MSFTMRGSGQSQITVTLSSNIVRPSGERKYRIPLSPNGTHTLQV